MFSHMMSVKDESAQNEKKKLLFCVEKGPGPAVYKLKTLTGTNDHCSTKSQAPAYSIGLCLKLKPDDTPGPQHYRYHSSMTLRGRQQTPTASFRGRPKPREMSNDVPGPGSYDWKYPELTRELTFGVPLKARTNEGPSPNAYEIKDGIGTSSSHIRASVPAWGIRSRTFFGSYYYEPIKAAGPGPAAYGTVDNSVTLRTNGRVTLKSRPANNSIFSPKTEGPGPATYSHPGHINSGRGFSFGIRHSAFLMPVMTGREIDD